MVVVLGADSEVEWNGSAGALGAAAIKALAAAAPAADIVGLIAPTGLPLLQAWQACLDSGRRPIILHYPTPKLSRVYWDDEIRRGIQTIGIDALLCADGGCVPQTDRPVIRLDQLTPAPADGMPTSGLSGSGSIIQMSSGTTGHRKGIVFTLDAVRAHAEAYNRVLGLGPDDCVVSWLPLYHDMGFVAAFLLPRLVGCRLVLIDPIDWVRKPELLWTAIERHLGTVCYMPNFGFEVMASRGQPTPTMRRWISCSEPTRRETMERFAAATATDPARLSNCWGMAENIFAVAQSDGVRTRMIDGAQVVGCGEPIPGTAVKVVDGELYVKSAYSLAGYVGGDLIVDSEGFYPTGDLGAVIDGEVFLQGRQRDLINHAGRKMLLSDLDFKVAQEVPEAAGRLASFAERDERLGTETPVVLIEDAAFWARNRDSALLARIAGRTGVEATRAFFVPPRFITKTSSGKVNRKKTAEHWRAAAEHRRRLREATPGSAAARAEAEIRDVFPGLDLDRPLGEQIDSLGRVNLALILAKHGLRSDPGGTEAVRSVLAGGGVSGETEEVIKIVTLCDREPFAGKFMPILDGLLTRYDRPVQLKHLCVPPAPILLSDLIFADHFLPRDDHPGVYDSLLSVHRDLREASLVIVDDLVHYAWPMQPMIYPRISHDFRGDPLAAFLAVRWARYSEGHHNIACELLDGPETAPEEVNLHLERLRDYLGVPMLRIAYGDTPGVSDGWEVQGGGDAAAVATRGAGRFIADRPFQAQLLDALDRMAPGAPRRPGTGGPILDLGDQPHWCSWIVNRDLVDFVLDRFDRILVLGKPASVPYLSAEAARRGKQLVHRLDLQVPDEVEAVVQTGSSNRPQTDKPIFQIMGAGWPGEPAVNLPDDVLKLCPHSRIWSRHKANFTPT